MWHVNNEFGCHLDVDYSDAARDAFRGWLERRYASIDALNDAWGTFFWSQRYSSFDEVFPPRKAPYSHNPGQELDFHRFTSDAMLECYLMEKAILREAGATQPITTNFIGASRPTNYWQWADEIDIITDDCYPDPNDPESFRAAAFSRDLMRSLKPDVPWLLMEQSSSALNWRPSNAPKAPGQMAALSMQAVARGADGILFFQWRQSKAGAEKFHSAMLPHAGTRTRTWREIVGLGAELAALPMLPASRDARVAIVLDWENWWAIEATDHPVQLDYLALVQGWYNAVHAAHVQIDFVRAQSDLSGYAVVIAPNLYLLGADGAANLRSFAERGGHLLVTAFSDVVDDADRFRDGGYLTQLGGTLGIWLEDFGALAFPGGPGQTTAPFSGAFGEVTGTLLAEEIHLEGATAIGTYTGGRLDGRPAFTVHEAGRGLAYYLSTVPDSVGTAAIVNVVLERAGVEPLLPGLPTTVEAARRGDVLTLINHGETTVHLDISGEDLEGAAIDGLSLEPFGYRMFRTEFAPS